MPLDDRDWYRDELRRKDSPRQIPPKSKPQPRTVEVYDWPPKKGWLAPKPSRDWGGLFVRLGFWLLVLSAFFAFFWAYTSRAPKKSARSIEPVQVEPAQIRPQRDPARAFPI